MIALASVVALLGLIFVLTGQGEPADDRLGAGDTADVEATGTTGTAAPPSAAPTDSGEPTDSAEPTDDAGDDGTSAGGELATCSGAGGSPPADSAIAFYALCVENPDLGLHPVYRSGLTLAPDPAERLEQQVEQLVAGTSGAERAELLVGFDAVADGELIDVILGIDPDGVVSIEFRLDGAPWSPGALASTSAQAISFHDPLMATLFAEPGVTAVDLAGLCWGDLDCTGRLDRIVWEAQLFQNQGAVSHAGCDLADTAVRPERCTTTGLAAASTSGGVVVAVADDDTLNLRVGPGADFPIVGEVPPGGEVAVTVATVVAEDGGTWGIVEGAGAVGWVNLRFVAVDP